MKTDELEILMEVMESHLNFAINNPEEDIDSAIESFGDKIENTKNKANAKLVKAAIGYMSAKTMETIHSHMTNLGKSLKKTVRETVRSFAIPMGMDSVECIDKYNIIGYLQFNRQQMETLYALINELVTKYEKFSKKSEKKFEMLRQIEMRLDVLKVDYNRWVSNMKGNKVLVKDLCTELKYLDSLSDKIEAMSDSANTIIKHLKNANIEFEDQSFSKDLIKIANAYITFIDLIIRQLQGSISFLSKAKNVIMSNKSSVKTKNDYLNIMND